MNEKMKLDIDFNKVGATKFEVDTICFKETMLEGLIEDISLFCEVDYSIPKDAVAFLPNTSICAKDITNDGKYAITYIEDKNGYMYSKTNLDMLELLNEIIVALIETKFDYSRINIFNMNDGIRYEKFRERLLEKHNIPSEGDYFYIDTNLCDDDDVLTWYSNRMDKCLKADTVELDSQGIWVEGLSCRIDLNCVVKIKNTFNQTVSKYSRKLFGCDFQAECNHSAFDADLLQKLTSEFKNDCLNVENDVMSLSDFDSKWNAYRYETLEIGEVSYSAYNKESDTRNINIYVSTRCNNDELVATIEFKGINTHCTNWTLMDEYTGDSIPHSFTEPDIESLNKVLKNHICSLIKKDLIWKEGIVS